jgi:5-methylcytosine-specific restriction enzyme A
MRALLDRITGKTPWFAKRSSKWPALRKSFLKTHPACAACGTNQKLEIHHCVPFHIDKTLELVESNLITLCDGPNGCHFHIGHLNDWKLANPNVIQDALESLYKAKN